MEAAEQYPAALPLRRQTPRRVEGDVLDCIRRVVIRVVVGIDPALSGPRVIPNRWIAEVTPHFLDRDVGNGRGGGQRIDDREPQPLGEGRTAFESRVNRAKGSVPLGVDRR